MKQNMSRSDTEFLLHIKDELNFLETNSKNIDFSKFIENEVLKRAFSRSLEIIGKAVKNIPEEIRYENPQVDWKSIAIVLSFFKQKWYLFYNID